MANPRKFSEKIALHNQKQAEETAAFEQIMKEVMGATRDIRPQTPASPQLTEFLDPRLHVHGAYQKHHLHITQSLGTFRAGSLPNVNQIGNNSIDLQSALNNLEDIKQGRDNFTERHLRERGRHAVPHRNRHFLLEKRIDVSPYGSTSYLSPPLDTSWRRTNSDSALHQSAMAAGSPQDNLFVSANSPPTQRKGLSILPHEGVHNLSDHSTFLLMDTGQHVKEYWDPKKEQEEIQSALLMNSRPKSCEAPGANILSPLRMCPLQPDDPGGNMCGSNSLLHLGINNNTGSLPDLSNLHFPPPLATPLDSEGDPLSSSPSSYPQQGMRADTLSPPNSHIIDNPFRSFLRWVERPIDYRKLTRGFQIHHQKGSTIVSGSNMIQSTSPSVSSTGSISPRHSNPGPAPSPSSRRRMHHNLTSLVIGQSAGGGGMSQVAPNVSPASPHHLNHHHPNHHHLNHQPQPAPPQSHHHQHQQQQQQPQQQPQQQAQHHSPHCQAQQVCGLLRSRQHSPTTSAAEPPLITVEGLALDTNALSLDPYPPNHAYRVYTQQQQQPQSPTRHQNYGPPSPTLPQVPGGPYRSTTPSDHSCSAPTSPVSHSLSPTGSPGLGPATLLSKSPFTDSAYSSYLQQQQHSPQQTTSALQHQLEQFKMVADQEHEAFLNMLPDVSPVCTTSSSPTTPPSPGVFLTGLGDMGSGPPLREIVGGNTTGSPMVGVNIRNSGNGRGMPPFLISTGGQDNSLDNMYYSIAYSSMPDALVQSPTFYAKTGGIISSHQTTPQTPQTPTSIPDIILTAPDAIRQDFAKDLGSAMASMSGSFDADFFLSAEEASKAGLEPIDFEGFHMLGDTDITASIVEAVSDDAFSLDRS